MIAELKTLEGIFAGEDGQHQFRQTFIDAAESPSVMMDLAVGNIAIPNRVAALIKKRIRRGLDARVADARKQLGMSKSMFGNKDTKSLILFAMDRAPIFGHRTMLFHLVGLRGGELLG